MTLLYDEIRAAVAIRNAAVIAYNIKRTLAGGTPTPTQSSTDVLVIVDAQTGAEFRLPISELAADMAGDFASAAQGAKADTALQNAAAFATAAQGTKADTALQNAAAFATAAQGTKADTALQNAAAFATAAQGATADTALQDASDFVGSNGTVNAIVKLTQAAYDALDPVVSTTLYVITA